MTLHNVRKYFLRLLIMMTVMMSSFISIVFADTTKPPVQIGMSASLSGNNADIGKNMKIGLEIYFKKMNAAGGIQGRKLELIVLDDGYDPLRAGTNVRTLIDNNQILALIGNNGTPTAVVTAPIVNNKKILLFAPHTGANFLYKIPPDRYIINLRPSIAEETTVLIKAILTHGIPSDQIAFFTQNDAYGDAVYNGAIKELKKAGVNNPESLPYGRYDRNTLDVVNALSQIVAEAKKPPRAIILGGITSANGMFIKVAKKQFPNVQFFAVSGFVDPKMLDKEDSGKVIMTEVVPSSADVSLPAIAEYLQDLKTYGGGAQPNVDSLQGYLAAKLFVIGLQHAIVENKLTREGIIDVFENMNNVDLGIGIKISFNKNNHTAIHNVWLTVFKDKSFVPLTS